MITDKRHLLQEFTQSGGVFLHFRGFEYTQSISGIQEHRAKDTHRHTSGSENERCRTAAGFRREGML